MEYRLETMKLTFYQDQERDDVAKKADGIDERSEESKQDYVK